MEREEKGCILYYCSNELCILLVQAQQLNTQRQYNNARRSSGYALLCNTLAVIEYVFILTTGVMFVFIYFFGESVIY